MSVADSDLAWFALARMQNISYQTFQSAISCFQHLEHFFNEEPEVLLQSGFSQKMMKAIQAIDWEQAKRDRDWAMANHVHLLSIQDQEYPQRLREIPDPPLVLFTKGERKLLSQNQIAIVGTRHPSLSGVALAESFASVLTQSACLITSGLAAGIDAASHRGALKQGATIAVLGTGLQHIYPRSNRDLARRISENGLLISELPCDIPALKRNFPKRNRIISGLSLGVLVVEAAARSGSLITARLAGEQGREVFAIPGSILNPLSKGCHQLIQAGAKLVESAQDILLELGMQLSHLPISETNRGNHKNMDLPANSRKLLKILSHDTQDLNRLIAQSGLTSAEVSSMLLILELRGYVSKVPGGYVLKSGNSMK